MGKGFVDVTVPVGRCDKPLTFRVEVFYEETSDPYPGKRAAHRLVLCPGQTVPFDYRFYITEPVGVDIRRVIGAELITIAGITEIVLDEFDLILEA